MSRTVEIHSISKHVHLFGMSNSPRKMRGEFRFVAENWERAGVQCEEVHMSRPPGPPPRRMLQIDCSGENWNLDELLHSVPLTHLPLLSRKLPHEFMENPWMLEELMEDCAFGVIGLQHASGMSLFCFERMNIYVTAMPAGGCLTASERVRGTLRDGPAGTIEISATSRTPPELYLTAAPALLLEMHQRLQQKACCILDLDETTSSK